MFISSFNYFYVYQRGTETLAQKLQGGKSSCPGEPYFTALGQTEGGTLGQFVDAVASATSPRPLSELPWPFRANNSQAFDFGIDHPDQIADTLAEFDLVLVLERLDHSLALLQNLLCTPWELITPFANSKANSKSYDPSGPKYRLTADQSEFVTRNLLNLDMKLYQAAIKKLNVQVEGFGQKALDGLVQQHFRAATDQRVRMARVGETRGRMAKRLSPQQRIRLADYKASSGGACPRERY